MMKFTPLLALLVFVGFSDAGVSFIRWGRTTCPTGSQVLYKGYMTGHHYVQKGSGANMLCASQDPKFVRSVPGLQTSGNLWGVEFEKEARYEGLFLKDNLPGGELHNQDLLCVRCYIASSTDVFVLPGRDDCANSGYDFQYKGFLVAEFAGGTDRQTSEYICLDEAPEGRVGGTGDDNNAVVYPVEARCGSLPCNPYTEGSEMTCAVCAY